MARENLRFGDANAVTPTTNGIEIPDSYRNVASPMQAVGYILGKQIENDSKLFINRWPAKAIVLGVFYSYCSGARSKPELNGADDSEEELPKLRLFVKAHIPEIHGSLRLPEKFSESDYMSVGDRRRLGMHPTFVGEADRSEMPMIGDMVYVDYDNRSSLIGPTYVGIAEYGPQGMLDEGSPTFSGKGFFDKAKDRRNKPRELRAPREQFLNADFYQYPMTLADY